jgi:hypothetical protein
MSRHIGKQSGLVNAEERERGNVIEDFRPNYRFSSTMMVVVVKRSWGHCCEILSGVCSPEYIWKMRIVLFAFAFEFFPSSYRLDYKVICVYHIGNLEVRVVRTCAGPRKIMRFYA